MASISSPEERATPVARPAACDDVINRGLGPDLGPRFTRRRGDGLRNRAGAAAGNAPGAESAVDLAHVVVQEDVGGSRRTDALEGADDARCRHRCDQRVGFEPLLQKVGSAHRHELQEYGLVMLGQDLKSLAERGQRKPLGQFEALSRRRRQRQHGLDEASHVDHEPPVLVVGLGVQQRPSPQLPHCLAVVVDTPQVVVVQGREGAVQRQDLEPVPGELELADDLGAQQTHNIGADAEAEALEDLFGHRRAAEDVAALEHQHSPAGARQISGAHKAVVASADHNCVIFLAHILPFENVAATLRPALGGLL